MPTSPGSAKSFFGVTRGLRRNEGAPAGSRVPASRSNLQTPGPGLSAFGSIRSFFDRSRSTSLRRNEEVPAIHPNPVQTTSPQAGEPNDGRGAREGDLQMVNQFAPEEAQAVEVRHDPSLPTTRGELESFLLAEFLESDCNFDEFPDRETGAKRTVDVLLRLRQLGGGRTSISLCSLSAESRRAVTPRMLEAISSVMKIDTLVLMADHPVACPAILSTNSGWLKSIPLVLGRNATWLDLRGVVVPAGAKLELWGGRRQRLEILVDEPFAAKIDASDLPISDFGKLKLKRCNSAGHVTSEETLSNFAYRRDAQAEFPGVDAARAQEMAADELNGLAVARGEAIVCRHLAILWLDLQEKYEIDKLSNPRLRFSYEPFSTVQRIAQTAEARALDPTTSIDEDIYQTYLRRASGRAVFADQLGPYLADRGSKLAVGESARMFIAFETAMGGGHGVALVMTRRAARFVIKFYDPNETRTHRRAVFKTLTDIGENLRNEKIWSETTLRTMLDKTHGVLSILESDVSESVLPDMRITDADEFVRITKSLAKWGSDWSRILPGVVDAFIASGAASRCSAEGMARIIDCVIGDEFFREIMDKLLAQFASTAHGEGLVQIVRILALRADLRGMLPGLMNAFIASGAAGRCSAEDMVRVIDAISSVEPLDNAGRKLRSRLFDVVNAFSDSASRCSAEDIKAVIDCLKRNGLPPDIRLDAWASIADAHDFVVHLRRLVIDDPMLPRLLDTFIASGAASGCSVEDLTEIARHMDRFHETGHQLLTRLALKVPDRVLLAWAARESSFCGEFKCELVHRARESIASNSVLSPLYSEATLELGKAMVGALYLIQWQIRGESREAWIARREQVGADVLKIITSVAPKDRRQLLSRCGSAFAALRRDLPKDSALRQAIDELPRGLRFELWRERRSEKRS